MANDGVSWEALLRETLTDDPEWSAYVRSLSPKTPLRRAVAGYVHMLSARLAPTPREIQAAERILAAMERSGAADIDEYLEATEPRRRSRQDSRPATVARSAARNPG